MIHNGIEYGVMAAYAEGFNILHNADIGTQTAREGCGDHAAAHPRALLVRVRRRADRGSVAPWQRRASWLLDLTARALAEDAGLAAFAGRVSDSGEGRWTVAAAVDEGVPAPVITAALYSRFESRGNADYGDRLLSAMRKQFGGHVEKKGRRVTLGSQEYSRTIATISRRKSAERTAPLTDRNGSRYHGQRYEHCAADDRLAAA